MHPLIHPRPGELVLLAAERTVAVTREEPHQDVLAGRAGQAIAELRPCRITAGKYAGEDGLEVALDGRRVGELTRLMAQRYRPMVDEIRARGRRAGCEAVLRDDARGIQVVLRLPAVTEREKAEPPTDPFGIPTSPAAAPWPRRRPSVTTVLPPPASYPVPIPPPTRRRRPGRVLGMVTGAVVGVLVLASALGSGSRDEAPAGSSTALPSAAAVPVAVDPDPVTTSAEPVDEPEVAAAGRSTAQARPPAASKSATSRPTTSKPALRSVQAAPKPEPKSNCHPSYSPCLPDGPDLDCGDIDGRVVVKGPDEYRLDADRDGIGCD